MKFNEANTVEQMILDAVSGGNEPRMARMNTDKELKKGVLNPCKSVKSVVSSVREITPGWGDSLGGDLIPSTWDYIPASAIPRQAGDVMVEAWVREALIVLNPEIAAQPDRADEVIYNIRACILSVQADGLVRANENFMAWARGEKTMPFGPHGEHVSVRLIDTGDPDPQDVGSGPPAPGGRVPGGPEKRINK